MIPEDAVEAAAKKLAYLNSDAGDQLSDEDWARELLEAAAPHLMAAAWDEAIDWTPEHRPANPYRKASDAH